MFVKVKLVEKMNVQENDILLYLENKKHVTQREISEGTGYSLGTVNKSLKSLRNDGYLTEKDELTKQSNHFIEDRSPKRAIILAAGFGMRMVPINTEIPKALLEVKGEILIERTIRQLHEVNIYDIYVVVGFMKEKFEYLIDKYGISLVVNDLYATTNNLYSLYLTRETIENAYIVPSDLWFKHNPYHLRELYSWYLVSDEMIEETTVRLTKKGELVKKNRGMIGNRMIGVAYLTRDSVDDFTDYLVKLAKDSSNRHLFWEEALFNKSKMICYAKMCRKGEVVEFNTYEDLRDFDSQSQQLHSTVLKIVADSLKTTVDNIKDIKVLKKGMTNRSFLFTCNDKRYIMRIPGEGTDQMINRQEEAAVYEVIKNTNISDTISYINSKTGYKITEFLSDARSCNPKNLEDVKKCMKKLREFHELSLSVEHEFDLRERILFYESLRKESFSVYGDYQLTKENVLSLFPYIESCKKSYSLCHIDAIPDNFLFSQNQIYLIDWEYSAMQDPHVDIAMFAIYALYNKNEIDSLIDLYFDKCCSDENRFKIYCYISICGLLWSNWCEYKRTLGVEFGEYSLRQYRYAKEYYKIAKSYYKERGIANGSC